MQGHIWAWDKDMSTDTEGHADTEPVHTGTHEHENPGHRHGGTVHIGGCTHSGTCGHGPIYAGTWSQMQCHCVHRRTQRDTDTATLRTDTHTHGPARDTAPGGTARTEEQGMLSDRILPGNTQNAALGMLMPSLDPASPPSLIPLRGPRNPQQHDNPMPQTPWSGSPVSSSAPSRASRPGRFPMR